MPNPWKRPRSPPHQHISHNIQDLLLKLLETYNDPNEIEPIPEDITETHELQPETTNLNMEPIPQELIEPFINDQTPKLLQIEEPINIEAPHFDGIDDLFRQFKSMQEAELVEIPAEQEILDLIEKDQLDEVLEAGEIY
jgi:hypothetical protein